MFRPAIRLFLWHYAHYMWLYLTLILLARPLYCAAPIAITSLEIEPQESGVMITLYHTGSHVISPQIHQGRGEKLELSIPFMTVPAHLQQLLVPLVDVTAMQIRPREKRTYITIEAKESYQMIPIPQVGKMITLHLSKYSPPAPLQSPPIPQVKHKCYIVVIDPGHGGIDSGARTPQGVLEKNVTYAMATQVRECLRQYPAIIPILTRERDIYLQTRQRFEVARQLGAHFFLSLHADSHPQSHISGMALYTLSTIASDAEAARLAKQENSVDLLGVRPYATNTINSVLLGLSQRDTISAAQKFANHLKVYLTTDDKIMPTFLRNGDFAVLKAPDVSAALLELGYLSNPGDVARLTNTAYQRQLACRIAQAIHSFVHKE